MEFMKGPQYQIVEEVFESLFVVFLLLLGKDHHSCTNKHLDIILFGWGTRSQLTVGRLSYRALLLYFQCHHDARS